MGGSGRDWEFGVSRCKLLHVEWMSKEVLQYSIRNYIQSLGIDHDGRCIRKAMCVYIYIHTHTRIYVGLGHFAIQQKLAQCCNSTIL